MSDSEYLFTFLIAAFLLMVYVMTRKKKSSLAGPQEEKDILDTHLEHELEDDLESEPFVEEQEVKDHLVTVMTFTYPHEMALVVALLESENIETVSRDELTVSANPLMSNMVGGVKLQVWSSDLEQAVSVLKKAGYLKD